MTAVVELHEQIVAVCPIDGVSLGQISDKRTWRIDFSDKATPEQREAARGVVDAFDVVAAERPRRRVAKSTVLARLSDAQLDAALAMMTTRQRERWRAPDHPAIYADDPEAIALLAAIGADPAVVLAP